MTTEALKTQTKVTDELVLKMRKACRENGDITARTFSEETGISVDTLSKAIRGDTFKRLNHLEAPFSKSPFMVTDEDAIAMRIMALTNDHCVVYEKFKHLGIAPGTVRNIVIGMTYRHLNDVAPPVKKDVRKLDQKARAREMSAKGFSYAEIVDELGVSISSVSNWCRDIVKTRTPRPRKTKPRDAEETKRRAQVSAAKKEEVRALYRAGEMSTREIAAHCNVSKKSLHTWTLDLRGLRPKRVAKARGKKVELAQPPFAEYYLHIRRYSKFPHRAFLVHKDTGESISMYKRTYDMSVHMERRIVDPEVVVVINESLPETLDNLKIITRVVGSHYVPKEFEHHCPNCDNDFKSVKKEQTYCSSKCFFDATRGRPKPKKNSSTKRSTTREAVERVECVICDMKFIPNAPDRDVCYSKSCNDLIQGVDDYDAETERT